MSKEKHLEMIQAVINRMAHNSFLLKGWSVVLVSALFVLAGKDAQIYFACLAIFPALMFWCLDGYFLWQERMYRELYDAVRQKEDDQIDYSMNAYPFKDKIKSWFSTCFSITLFIFHGAIVFIIVLVIVLLLAFSK